MAMNATSPQPLKQKLDYGHSLEFGSSSASARAATSTRQRAMGAPARTPGESIAALEEAVAVMRAMWSGERRGIRFDGRYYQLEGVHAGPVPAHPIQVWIGADKPRALALTARVADGWVSPLMNYRPPGEAAQKNLAIDRAARDAGRHARFAASTSFRASSRARPTLRPPTATRRSSAHPNAGPRF
jgi:alkanesulfonate monooxygenase SsuD/methylene tetrahydromethanopterin reductase-like flavin-dependent oxidoreductase (luciferase family)